MGRIGPWPPGGAKGPMVPHIIRGGVNPLELYDGTAHYSTGYWALWHREPYLSILKCNFKMGGMGGPMAPHISLRAGAEPSGVLL